MAPPFGSGRRWSRAVKMTLCLLFLIPMEAAGITNTNTKQKLGVQQQLKRLNKPALKSIKSPDGDIIDCVDINNQPAFDHPLLKNHTIQMRPSSHPEGLLFDESNNFSSNSMPKITQLWHLNGRCPKGTIPIRRTTEEDLLRANYGRKKHNTVPNDIDQSIHELIEEGDRYYGMNAEINVWNPQTMSHDEFSLSQTWIAGLDNGNIIDTIEAGMMVYYDLNRDYETRLFTYWTSDGYASTGCYNQVCPGFVQVESELALGASLMPYSQYDGTQHSINFFIWKDNLGDGNWWLYLAHRHQVGYWPSSLFSVLSDSATQVTWGGEVTNEQIGGQHTTTQMGSGQFADEGQGRASYFTNLKVMDDQQVLRAPSDNRKIVTKPNCYNLINIEDYFYFGGPGRNPNCP